ncbi:MAG: type I-C CRISPR-associated protein Cas8c/Csd1 [Candidatus Krumholzibacteriia bacterium]
MILKELDKLYDRLKIDPDYRIARMGFSLQKISFKVVLKPDGNLFAIQDMRISRGKKMVPTQVMVPGGTKPPGQGINPCFLWDNTKYMLGFTQGDDLNRTLKSFAAFRERHSHSLAEIQSADFAAVCSFLEGWDPAQAGDHPVLAEIGTGFGVFQIQGNSSYVHDDPVVLDWWENQPDPSPEFESFCLVTGKYLPIAKTHDKVKGVVGGQSTGGAIVSYNEKAYESYQLEQSFNAPVGSLPAFRYVTALNAILDGPMRDKHRMLIGDTTVAFWTDRPTIAEDVMALFLNFGSYAGNADAVQDETLRRKLTAFLEFLRQGKAGTLGLENVEEDTGYNLLGLAPNAGRISVRFHHRGTLGQFLDHQRQHFRDISICQDRSGPLDGDEFPSIRRLLDEVCPRVGGKPDRDRIPPVLIGPLMRSVIGGSRYPDGVYNAVLGRIRADHLVNRVRAGIIKGYLIRNRGKEVSMSLDVNNPSVAYRLGRLFAVMEMTQGDALGGGVNATIRDRFYGAASATPRTVFPRLLRTYQHHLAKLQPGYRVNREKLVQEIVDPLIGFPGHFDLTDQGLFAIGYYHQTRAFYQKTEAKDSQERTDS